MPIIDFWDEWVRQADQANHNPPTASNAVIARVRCFIFILYFDSSLTYTFARVLCTDFWELSFDLVRSWGILGAKRQKTGMNVGLGQYRNGAG
jgi:hypothetical protein